MHFLTVPATVNKKALCSANILLGTLTLTHIKLDQCGLCLTLHLTRQACSLTADIVL